MSKITMNNGRRSRKFTDEERRTLFTLLDKYLAIIENKKMDAAACASRTQTWEQIAKEFNAHNIDEFRSVASLRKCYINHKHRSRKSLVADEEMQYAKLKELHTIKIENNETNLQLFHEENDCSFEDMETTESNTSNSSTLNNNARQQMEIAYKDELYNLKRRQMEAQEERANELHAIELEKKKLELEKERTLINIARIDLRYKKIMCKLKLKHLRRK